MTAPKGRKARRAQDNELLHLSKAKHDRLEAIAFGANIFEKTGTPIKSLRAQVISDRIALAREILKQAERQLAATPPSYRSAVSRAYYAMYHLIRAVVYYHAGGDDHEDHTKLPGEIPKDFPDVGVWTNTLKQARFERNRADYDPYPKQDAKFSLIAEDLVAQAKRLTRISRNYLLGKGAIT